jgi:hypothetical protein
MRHAVRARRRDPRSPQGIEKPASLEVQHTGGVRDMEAAGIELDYGQKPNRLARRDFGRIGL